MVESNALWHSSTRKEAMDLLDKLWRTLDEDGRLRLEARLLEGPPDALFARLDEEERTPSRDRRLFERVMVVERVGDPPLTPGLAQCLEALKAKYPQWRVSSGDQAHFRTWMQTRWGPDARLSADQLAAMDDAVLAETLRTDFDRWHRRPHRHRHLQSPDRRGSSRWRWRLRHHHCRQSQAQSATRCRRRLSRRWHLLLPTNPRLMRWPWPTHHLRR